MSIAVVNDYYFKPDADVMVAKKAASGLIDYFNKEVPEVQLSLWLEDQDNPLHHYHITVFNSNEDLLKVKNSEAINQFIDKVFPLIAHSTYVSPVCDVWLADGVGVDKIPFGKK